MPSLTAQFSVAYVVMCEWALSVLFGYVVWQDFQLRQHDAESLLVNVCFGLIAVVCLVVGVGMTSLRRWAWFSSVGIGVLVLLQGLYCLFAPVAREVGNTVGGGFDPGVGLTLAIASACGVGMLLLAPTRRYFFGSRSAYADWES